MSMKLYKVNLRPHWGEFYVIAKSSDAAYKKVRVDLENREIGSQKDRELRGILLLAEDVEYPDCETRLYV